ncbi:MAG: universal stress protein [Nitriliruptorales bacterium]
MFGDRLFGGTVGDVLRDAEADVAVLFAPDRLTMALPDRARILVPYGGGFHEDAGLDLALRLGASANAEVTLIGPGSAEGDSQLAQQAADAYERSGVWTKALPVEGDVAEVIARRATHNDFLVMGVSDHWLDDQESIGDIREELAQRSSTPFLIVRRHGGSRNLLRRWLSRLARRPQEWMEQMRHDKPRPQDGEPEDQGWGGG